MCKIGLRQLPPCRGHDLLVFLRCWCRRDMHDGVIAVCRNNLAGFPAQAVGSLPCLDSANTSPELLPEHDDAAIRGPQMLQAVDGNGPLTDLGLIVAGLPLARLVGISGELAGEHDVTIGPPRWRGAWSLADVPKFDEHGTGVVHGHNPAAHPGTAEGILLVAIFPDWGD